MSRFYLLFLGGTVCLTSALDQAIWSNRPIGRSTRRSGCLAGVPEKLRSSPSPQNGGFQLLNFSTKVKQPLIEFFIYDSDL